jgi:hypothetical protein
VIASNDCFCTRLSQDAGEQLCGTASTVDVWLLLEYAGRWGQDAFGESKLPASIRSRVGDFLNTQARSRLLFIRQHERKSTGLAFYVALSREQNPVLYEWRLNTYEELLDLDLRGIARQSEKYDEHISRRPVFLVCTHGVHDKCCAMYGRPVYAALARREETVVWQSSHVGGDRFAANVVCLPHGIYYGRVDKDRAAAAIVSACNDGEIYLEAYRGRSCYNFVVQAAEYFIRQQTGNLRLDGLQLLGVQQTQNSRATVTFLSPVDALKQTVHVSREPMGVQNYLVCKAQELSELFRFRLEGCEVEKLD